MSSIVEALPYDLIATIVDLIAEEDDNKKTLKSCSLSCRTFLIPCQKKIFRRIKLTDFRWAATLADRFASTIETTPRLADYVLELDWLLMNESFNPFSPVPTAFQRLRNLQIISIDYQRVTPFQLQLGSSWKKIPTLIKSTLLYLMQLPTVVSLSFQSQGHGFTLSDLVPCPNLKNFYISTTTICDEDSKLPSEPPAKSIKLQELELQASATAHIARMLKKGYRSDGLALFDLTELRQIRICNLKTIDHAKSSAQLLRYASNLETLDLILNAPPEVGAQSLGFLVSAALSTLKSLNLVIVMKNSFDSLHSFCTVLGALSEETNCLQNLNIRFQLCTVLQDPFVLGGDWNLLEDVLLSPGWSSFAQVNIRIDIRNLRASQVAEARTVLDTLPKSELSRLLSTSSFDFKYTFSASEFMI